MAVKFKIRLNHKFNSITLFLESDKGRPHRFFQGLSFGEETVDWDWGTSEGEWVRASVCVPSLEGEEEKLVAAIKAVVKANRDAESENLYEA